MIQYITDEDVWEAENPGLKDRTRFFGALLSDGLPDDVWANIWRLRGRWSDWIQTVEQAEVSATNYGRMDVYIGLGLSDKRRSSNERLSNDTAAGLLGVGGDVDIFWEGNPKTTIPPDLQTALAFIDTLALPPTFVIDSGHGCHCWWLFQTPWRFGEGEREQAADLSYRWQALINARAAEHGWKLDSVGDLARLLRVPGTENAKAKQILSVFTIRETSARYTPDQLAEVCKDIVVPDHIPSSTASYTSDGSEPNWYYSREETERMVTNLLNKAIRDTALDKPDREHRNPTAFRLGFQLGSLGLSDDEVAAIGALYDEAVHDGE